DGFFGRVSAVFGADAVFPVAVMRVYPSLAATVPFFVSIPTPGGREPFKATRRSLAAHSRGARRLYPGAGGVVFCLGCLLDITPGHHAFRQAESNHPPRTRLYSGIGGSFADIIDAIEL